MVRILFAGFLGLFLVNAAQAAEGHVQIALLSAGDKGNVEAQVLLGSQYLLGNGVARDAKAAHRWYRKAADQGHPRAQTILGLLYVAGTGVKANSNYAATWFRRAALQGYAEAQFWLGTLYADGRGVERDYVEAHMWFSLAVAKLPPGRALDEAIQLRQFVAQRMTNDQIAESKDLATGMLAFQPR